MKVKEITCIRCPLGCNLTVEMEEGEVASVKGNQCPRGKSYAMEECVNPKRTMTTSLPVVGGTSLMVPVKTKEDIPKDKVEEAANSLKGIKVNAPIRIGDVLVENIVGTGVDMVATGNVAVQTVS